MTDEDRLIAIIRADSLRWHLLGIVCDLNLRDCWIAAGFVRNAAWDTLHKRRASELSGDVDVVWFDPEHTGEEHDRAIEEILRSRAPTVAWSVKNQARMHSRNADEPYQSTTDAMRYWPETATAVGIRRTGMEDAEIACPFGLDDLWGLIVRPAGKFANEKRPVFDQRVQSKGWLSKWPSLSLVER